MWPRKKYRDIRTPQDIAALELAESIDWGSPNYSDLQKVFISRAIPDAPRWKSELAFHSTLSSDQIRQLLTKVSARKLSLDELASQVFGFASYMDFVEEFQEKTGLSRGVVSDKAMSVITSHKWSETWQQGLRDGLYANSGIRRMCGRLGSFAAPVFFQPGMGDPYDDVFTSAAQTGFFAVANSLGLSIYRVETWFSKRGLVDLVDLATVTSPRSPDPIKGFDYRCNKAIENALHEIEVALNDIARKYPRTIYIGGPTAGEGLRRAAKLGATLACLAYDPSQSHQYLVIEGHRKKVQLTSLEMLP